MEELLRRIPHQCALLGTQKENNDPVIRLYQRPGFEVVIDSFQYSEGSSELSPTMSSNQALDWTGVLPKNTIFFLC